MATKKVNEIRPIRMSLSSVETLKSLKETGVWTALREWMALYIQQQKDIAWHLNEADDKFVIRHAQYTSRAAALNDLILFVEKEVRRASEEQKEDVNA